MHLTFRCPSAASPEDAAHHALITELRSEREQRNPIDRHFAFSFEQRVARAEFETAAKTGALRQIPTCFGALS